VDTVVDIVVDTVVDTDVGPPGVWTPKTARNGVRDWSSLGGRGRTDSKPFLRALALAMHDATKVLGSPFI
jgi:hypothetical protein